MGPCQGNRSNRFVVKHKYVNCRIGYRAVTVTKTNYHLREESVSLSELFFFSRSFPITVVYLLDSRVGEENYSCLIHIMTFNKNIEMNTRGEYN